MLRYQAACFSIEKAGNRPDEYEDAYESSPKLPSTPEMINEGEHLHLAIADGATESSFAQQWARLLVRHYVRTPFRSPDDLAKGVSRIAKSWSRTIASHQLPWYAEEKVAKGAFSTLLGIEFCPNTVDNTWRAIAVGDSCLFQIRDTSLHCAFPLQTPEAFNNSPLLISSNHAQNEQVWTAMCVAGGEWQPGDTFILATDALSHWLLRNAERNSWEVLIDFAKQPLPDFLEWISALREKREIRNDDVTVVVIHLV